MKKETITLLKLLNEGKTLNEMSDRLRLSNMQIFMKLSMLRNSGYLLKKHYHYDGNIKYSLSSPFEKPENGINIEVEDHLRTIRALLISDTHLGNIKDNADCYHSMIEYCVTKDIHIILHTGDFFEGIYENYRNQARYKTAKEQISYGLKAYPYHKKILTFMVLGNHDATFWSEYGLDIKTILQERRHDVVPIAYGYGELCIGPCKISLHHPLSASPYLLSKSEPNMINLRGHSHKFKIVANTDSLLIYVPTISNISTGQTLHTFPSMIDMKLKINDDHIYDEYFQQLLFIDNKICQVGEFKYNIPMKLDRQETFIETHRGIPDLEKNLKPDDVDHTDQIEKHKNKEGKILQKSLPKNR